MDSDIKYWLMLWGIIVAGITIVLSTLIIGYYSARIKYTEAGLQQCSDYGTAITHWQKECRK